MTQTKLEEMYIWQQRLGKCLWRLEDERLAIGLALGEAVSKLVLAKWSTKQDEVTRGEMHKKVLVDPQSDDWAMNLARSFTERILQGSGLEYDPQAQDWVRQKIWADPWLHEKICERLGKYYGPDVYVTSYWHQYKGYYEFGVAYVPMHERGIAEPQPATVACGSRSQRAIWRVQEVTWTPIQRLAQNIAMAFGEAVETMEPRAMMLMATPWRNNMRVQPQSIEWKFAEGDEVCARKIVLNLDEFWPQIANVAGDYYRDEIPGRGVFAYIAQHWWCAGRLGQATAAAVQRVLDAWVPVQFDIHAYGYRNGRRSLETDVLIKVTV